MQTSDTINMITRKNYLKIIYIDKTPTPYRWEITIAAKILNFPILMEV
jgi:hypothetical protein